MTGGNWTTFGSAGTGINQFGAPTSIFVDSAYRIYVADVSNNRIVRTNDMTGTFWTAFGGVGRGAANSMHPSAYLSMLPERST